jgi:glycosyltransferase involved in cell wall biosynthesis
MPLLSIIVPVYNEANTIRQILDKINAVPIDKEVILVDDGSSDGTDRILRELQGNNLKLIHHTTNRGKGAAFLTGLAHSSGEFVIIQDADLEYDPGYYLKLVEPLKADSADMVLGARFLKGHTGLFMHRLGNRFLTAFLNLLFKCRLNDYLTCYKLAPRKVWDSLNLKAERFDIEAEIICNALKKKLRIVEIPIAYYPRTYKAGKKIRWKDGLQAILSIIRYRFS